MDTSEPTAKLDLTSRVIDCTICRAVLAVMPTDLPFSQQHSIAQATIDHLGSCPECNNGFEAVMYVRPNSHELTCQEVVRTLLTNLDLGVPGHRPETLDQYRIVRHLWDYGKPESPTDHNGWTKEEVGCSFEICSAVRNFFRLDYRPESSQTADLALAVFKDGYEHDDNVSWLATWILDYINQLDPTITTEATWLKSISMRTFSILMDGGDSPT